MMLNSKENNKALDNLNNKLLKRMTDRGILASYLMSLLSNITTPENSTQFKLVKDSKSNRVNDLLAHNTVQLSLFENLLTFRDTSKVFELKGDFLKKITNKNYNVDLACSSDGKLMYDFPKDMYFDVKAMGNKSTRDYTLIKLLKSPSIMVCASGVSKTIFLPSDLKEICDRLKLFSQEVQASNKCHKINEEILVIVDVLLAYKCKSTKQHKQNLNKCNLSHTKKSKYNYKHT